MLLLNEITYDDDGGKRENKILINPYLVVTLRQFGVYSLMTTVDGQEIKLTNTIFSIKKMLSEYDLSLIDSSVVKDISK